MVACYSRKTQTLRVNNSIILRTNNAKFSEYYFHLNTNIYGDFQICISVPLKPHVVVFVFTVFSFHSFPFFCTHLVFLYFYHLLLYVQQLTISLCCFLHNFWTPELLSSQYLGLQLVLCRLPFSIVTIGLHYF